MVDGSCGRVHCCADSLNFHTQPYELSTMNYVLFTISYQRKHRIINDIVIVGINAFADKRLSFVL